MALSVSRGLGSEIPVSDFDRPRKGNAGGGNIFDLWFCRMRGGGVERPTGPCSFVGAGSAQGSDIAAIGSAEGSDGNESISPISAFEKEALLGQSFLGQGLLRGYGGSGCGYDTQVCPLSREERATVGADATNRLRFINDGTTSWPAPLGAGPCPPYGGILQSHPLRGWMFTLEIHTEE